MLISKLFANDSKLSKSLVIGHQNPINIYKFIASSMVSGNFFWNVSGLKSTKIPAERAAPLNKKAGSDPYWAP